MNSPWSLSLALGATCVATAFAAPANAPKIPLEDFARGIPVSHATISPDGQAVAYQAVFEKDSDLVFLNLETRKTVASEVPYTLDPLQYGLGQDFQWIGSKRAVYSATARRYGAIDYDCRNYVKLGGGTVVHAFTGKREGETLQLYVERPTAILYDGQFYWAGYPSIVHNDTRAGVGGRFTPAAAGIYLQNPGDVRRWFSDGEGVVRIGVQVLKGQSRIIYRESETAGWHTPNGLDYSDPPVQALGLSGDGKTLYIGRVTPEGRWGVYTYNLVTQALGELILSHNHYDIIPPSDSALRANLVYNDGMAMQSLVFSRVRQELLGIRYVTIAPQTLWLDPTLLAIQGAVDQALPKRINTITSFSDDLTRSVILSWTARDPGTYYLFDLNKKSLSPLFPRVPWIKPEQMAQVYPISYKARDGLVIDGYLTVPVGREPKHLPLIVHPHDGPFWRDSLRFDITAQFLASRGYAVLQMNYRGSTGYGDDFANQGRREFGGKIQDDIADATQWAIEKGIADPARVAIMGTSFGGYSALMGLSRTPALYRCGIDIAGITDWVALLKNMHDLLPPTYDFYREMVGDMDKDAAQLEAISPVNRVGDIKVPVLIAHGEDDPIFPYPNIVKFTAALKQANHPYDLMAARNEMHGFEGYKDVAALFARIEQFLATNMPADADVAANAH